MRYPREGGSRNGKVERGRAGRTSEAVASRARGRGHFVCRVAPAASRGVPEGEGSEGQAAAGGVMGSVMSGRSIGAPKHDARPEGSALLTGQRKKKLPIGGGRVHVGLCK